MHSETSQTSRHIDNVVSVALSGASAGAAPRGPEALFHKSWERCVKQHGLDPTRPTPARILPSPLVREHQQRMEGFMRVARAGMEHLYGRVADLGYMLLLTDADGITVDYIGNPASEPQLKAAGLYVGADWNEAHSGTCGVGTCLIEQDVITCHQAEHFDATHIALTCTSAPLFAPDGQLLGVLDVSALHSPEARESQHLVLHLAAIYAQQIEDANFMRHFARHEILRLGSKPGLVEVAGDVMLAYDEEGVIVGANTGARKRFGGGRRMGATPLVGQTLHEVVGIGMDAVRSMARGGGTAVVARASEPLYPAVIAPRDLRHRIASIPLAEPVPARSRLDSLFGDDPAMQELSAQARRLAAHRVNLMISGETGAGKEVFAHALHDCGPRAGKPFVAVNCASIPESLIESELFGYTPGSFTGGKSKGMKGLIAQSDGGTLFLDEIGDMPLALQTRLLRVLAENEVLPLGAERPVAVDLHVMAASHRDLADCVASGTFREDLYYRLCGANLHLPPLREREDKPYLVNTMFAQEAVNMGLEGASLTGEAMQALLDHHWPGNLRELRNALRYALALAGARPLGIRCLPPNVFLQRVVAPSRPVVAEAEPARVDTQAQRLQEALKQHKWNITSTARSLGLCRATIYRQMQRHGITAPHLL